ncbi:hypothetical protein [Aedoeadaptatus coxii]|uniref:tetratricopeptide repeat protein n=1 Tax=Aedoeadaptatus coxii TaxID=755172 RepID=UPI002AD51377|nr:hypothetical protein [Peptoniphilus coxii]
MRTISTKVRVSKANDVQIADAYLAQNEIGFALVIDIINNTYQSIRYLKLDVLFINAFGKFIFDETVFQHGFENLNLKPKSLSFLPYWMLDERHHTARGVRIRISEVHFDDGTRKYYDRTKEYYQTVPIITKEKKDELKKLFGPDFYTYGGRYPELWRCICGFVNSHDDENCRYCKRSRDFVLSAVTERQVNKKLFQLYIDRDREKAEQATITEQTMPIRPLDEIDLERSEEKKEHTLSKKKRILLFVIISVSIIALSAVAFKAYDGVTVRRHYEEAQNYIAAGDYDSASAIYDTLPPIVENKDMALKIEELDGLKASANHYRQGLELHRAGNLLGAYAHYRKVVEGDRQNYLNAAAMMGSIENATLRQGATLIAEGKRDEAKNLLETLCELNPENKELRHESEALFTK